MRNRWILLGYLVLFFLVISSYDAYKENDLLVILAAAIILIGGLAAWIWSVQPRKGDGDGES
jgi:O-antigen ligase